MRTSLVPLDGGPPFELAKDLILVGRTEDCDLRLDHKSVSKLHCVLVRTEGLVLVRDLGSTNGTRVNGQRVRRAALLPNDNLAIATFRYKVTFGDDADGGDQDGAADPEMIRRNALPDEYPSG
jgi:pSer/pThr/pTyr-binding forkhead associated (FHA) protein